MTETIQTLLIRDLHQLKREIELYRHETKIWYTEKSIANSAGNLCLHLIGNLNTYIGAALGNSGYVRQRELEFSRKNIPREELLNQLDDTIKMVATAMNHITKEELTNDFPVLIWDQPATIEYTLIHLTTHLTYHLGQINYHRRLLDI